MKNIREIILNILEVINFDGDREEFVNEFIKNVELQATASLFHTLVPGKLEEFKKQAAENSADQEKLAEIMKNYFSVEQMEKAMEDSSKKAIAEWM